MKTLVYTFSWHVFLKSGAKCEYINTSDTREAAEKKHKAMVDEFTDALRTKIPSVTIVSSNVGFRTNSIDAFFVGAVEEKEKFS